MNRSRITTLTMLTFLGLSSPCHAMIELLPFFFAGVALFTLAAGTLVGALLKAPILRLLTAGTARVSTSAIIGVAVGEFLILALSLFVCFHRMSSEAPAFRDRGLAFLVVVFVCSTVLYAAIAVLPNLYLLGKGQARSETDGPQFQRMAYAALLAAPTPLLTFTLTIVLYLAAR
jgi:hypothetical protein